MCRGAPAKMVPMLLQNGAKSHLFFLFLTVHIHVYSKGGMQIMQFLSAALCWPTSVQGSRLFSNSFSCWHFGFEQVYVIGLYYATVYWNKHANQKSKCQAWTHRSLQTLLYNMYLATCKWQQRVDKLLLKWTSDL